MDPHTVLDKLVANRQLSPEAREWLIVALDPYHDWQTKPSGYPDLCGSDTVVLCINGSMTVTSQGLELSEGDTWDCNVFNLPNLAASKYVALRYEPETGRLRTEHDGNEPAPFELGFVNAIRTKSGNDTLPRQETPNLETWRDNVVAQSITPELPPGAGRMIAGGFEVTNTTASMLQQGSVRYYRSSGTTVESEVFSDVFQTLSNVQTGPVVGTPDAIHDLHFYGPSSCLADSNQGGQKTGLPARQYVSMGMLPPGSLDDATNIPSSVQHHAREGGYSVITFNDPTNKLRPRAHHALLLTSGDSEDDEAALIQFPNYKTWRENGNSLGPGSYIQPITINGQYYSGLSKETSLVITYKLYYEFAPAPGNAFMALASPSCPSDDVVFELYSAVVRKLPVAVPVKYNSIGSFFKSIGNFLKKIVVGGGVAKVGRIVAPQAGQVWDKMDQIGAAIGPRKRTSQSNASSKTLAR